MKKYFFITSLTGLMIFASCGNSSHGSADKNANSIDSAANNGIIPPSSSPSNATNSSLADTAYPAKDSLKSSDSSRAK
jgi:hypothetical protein